MELHVLALASAWRIGLVVNGIVAVACLVMAWSALADRRPYDPLRGLAPATLFLMLGAMHWLHALVLAFPDSVPSGQAGREFLADWRIYAVEAVTAIVGLAYLALRLHRRGQQRVTEIQVRTAERQREALQIQDNVVQGLAAAKLALETGRHDEARALVAESLAHAKGIITELMRDDLSGGALRRDAPQAGGAGVSRRDTSEAGGAGAP